MNSRMAFRLFLEEIHYVLNVNSETFTPFPRPLLWPPGPVIHQLVCKGPAVTQWVVL